MVRSAAVAVAVAVAAALLAAACSGAPGKPPRLTAQPGDLVIADVTIAAMDRPDGGALAHRTVIVRGDRIAAVEPSDQVDVPAGAVRIDGAGKWLMPGLADMHAHTWDEQDLTLYVAAGVTTIRNMFGTPRHLQWRSEIVSGKRFGPTIVTASPLIDGDPPVFPGGIVLANPADADRIVGELKAQGYDFLKPFSRLSREAHDALVVAGRKHGMALGGHVPVAVGIRHALASGQRTIDHLDGWLAALAPLGEQLPADSSSPAYRAMLPRLEPQIPALVQEMIAAGAWNCPTLIVVDRVAALGDLEAARKRARWLELVPPSTLARWDPKADFRYRTKTAEDFAATRQVAALRSKIAAALMRANAPVLLGTDAGNPFVIPGESLHDEIELFVAAGVPRARVLRAATAGAAEHLGLGGRAGVVAAGARADLLLVDADPLAGPLPLVPAGVVLRGSFIPRAELEQKLAAIERSHAAPASKRLDGMPPLAAEGPELLRAHYDIVQKGKTIGEERLVAGQVAGGRALGAQLVGDFPLHQEASYTIGPARMSISAKVGPGTLKMDGKLERGALVVTGTDPLGGSISLSQPAPAGAFLAGIGIAGSYNLVEKLAGMTVGARQTVTSIELSFVPRASIDVVTHDVERKPDAGGLRVYSVKSKAGPDSFDNELSVDERGQIVTHSFGPPIDLVFQRSP